MADEERIAPGTAAMLDGVAGSARRICGSAELIDGADGARFDIAWKGESAAAFAIRYKGRVYAYLNRCAHLPVELDWNPGKFFDAERVYLICSTHGALYAPESGACRGGPCRGAGLVPLEVFEADGNIYLKD